MSTKSRKSKNNFDIEKAYAELEELNLYSSTSSTEFVGISELPKSIQSGETYNLTDLLYWSIAAIKAAQNKIKKLENKITQLEEKENGK